jgi:hypothetical protein
MLADTYHVTTKRGGVMASNFSTCGLAFEKVYATVTVVLTRGHKTKSGKGKELIESRTFA